MITRNIDKDSFWLVFDFTWQKHDPSIVDEDVQALVAFVILKYYFLNVNN